MKIFYAFLSTACLTVMTITCSAQWTRTAPNIYPTTLTDKVGIGVTAPQARLDVNQILSTQGTYDHQYWSTDNPAYSLRLQTVWSNSYGITHQFVHRSNNTDYNVLSFWSGKVGIGTPAPSSKFEVAVNPPAQGTYDIQSWGVSNPSYNLTVQAVWNNSGITHKFTQRFAGVNYPVLSFFSGNVGIGIDNPGLIDAKLAVKGTIHAQEVRVDLLGAVAPDYVFEPSYKLAPLAAVEQYIEANKHLPEVPSAAEMEKDGMYMKEMNLILLKKVEELTLHLIAQEKKIEEQNRRIEALEKK